MSIIPKEIGGVKLPQTRDTPATIPTDTSTTEVQLTAWALKIVQANASDALVTKIITEGRTAERMLQIRTISKGGTVQLRKLDLKRSQNADSVIVQVYGSERTGTGMCENCQKGTGPYKNCVVFTDGAACGNCTYNSGASRCSLASKRVGDPLTTPRKVKFARAELDFLETLRGIRPRQLAAMGRGILALAEKLDDIDYDPDEQIDVARMTGAGRS